MNRVTDKLTLLIENNRILKKDKLLHIENRRLAAFYYTFYNRVVDCVAIRNTHDMMVNHADVRFVDKVFQVSTLLSLYDSRADILNRINTVYDLMVEVGFLHDSEYVGVAAYLIAVGANPDDFKEVVMRARAHYEGLSAKKSFDIYECDYPGVALFGLSGINVSDGLARVELLYNYFISEIKVRPQFNGGILPLAMTLIYNNSIDVSDVVKFANALNSRRVWRPGFFSLEFALPTIISTVGLLSQLPVNTDTLLQQLPYAERFLRKQKGFTQWTTSRQEVYLTSILLVASAYLDEVKLRNGISGYTNILDGIIIAMQFSSIFGATAAEVASVGRVDIGPLPSIGLRK